MNDGVTQVSDGVGNDIGSQEPTAPGLDEGPRLPERIGRYLVVHELGRGGMGVVLSAYDPDLERKVAIKVVKVDHRSGSARSRDRMIREARAIAKIRHPNVVHVYDVGEFDEGVFIAMELVEGQDLAKWNASSRPTKEIVDVHIQAARGLIAAHDAGLIHRDFKPANVLIDNDGRVQVLDFGLARSSEESGVVSASHDPSEPASDRITKHGVIVGTPAYMSPEQLRGDDLDARSDQFALCVTLWASVAGQRPFRGRTMPALLEDIAGSDPRDPKVLVPARLREVLVRGLAFAAADRYADLRELLAELERARPRHRSWRAPLALGVVATIAVGWALSDGPDDACATGSRRVDEVWSATQRDAVVAALRRFDSPRARDAATRVPAHFDTVAARWRETYAAACVAGDAAAADRSEVFEHVALCLERRLTQFRRRIDTLTAADASVAAAAIDVARSMPPVERCTEAPSPMRDADVTPDQREQISEVHQRLDALSVRFAAGERTTLYEEAEAIVPAAEAAGGVSTHIDALAFRANVRRTGPTPERSDDDLRKAIELAIRLGDDEAAADNASALAYGYDHARAPVEAQHWIALAVAFVERGAVTTKTEVLVRRSDGELAVQAGDHARGVAVLQQLVERLRREPIDDGGLQLATTEIALGRALSIDEKPTEAVQVLQAARRRYEQTLGEHHPRIALAQYHEAMALGAVGRVDESVAAYEAVQRNHVDNGTWNEYFEAVWNLNVAATYRWGRRFEPAKRHARKSLELTASVKLPDPVVLQARGTLIDALLEEGDIDAADALLDLQEGYLNSHEVPDGSERNGARVLRARVELARGDMASAMRTLEEAYRRADELELASQHAQVGFYLAELLWRSGEDDVRARKLAQAALEQMNPLTAAERWRADQLRAWLESPPR